MEDPETYPRRRVLHLAGLGIVIGIAGCTGDGGGDESVPSAYKTATSIGGQKRDPNNLQSKDALQYQDTPKNGQRCADCTYYIKDKNDDGQGACTLVEGKISPDGWCSSFAPNK